MISLLVERRNPKALPSRDHRAVLLRMQNTTKTARPSWKAMGHCNQTRLTELFYWNTFRNRPTNRCSSVGPTARLNRTSLAVDPHMSMPPYQSMLSWASSFAPRDSRGCDVRGAAGRLHRSLATRVDLRSGASWSKRMWSKRLTGGNQELKGRTI